MSVYAKIHKAMSLLSSVYKDGVRKDKAGRPMYSYVSYDEVISTVHPVFVEVGLVAIPNVEEIRREGPATHVTLALTIVDVESGETVSIHFPGTSVGETDKAPNIATSYAYKGAILKLLMLESGDKVEEKGNSIAPVEGLNPKDIPDVIRLVEQVMDHMSILDIDVTPVMQKLGVDQLYELPKTRLQDMAAFYSKKVEAKKTKGE